MNLAICGADPDNSNRGLGALTFGSMYVLKKLYPNANLYFLDYSKDIVPKGRSYPIAGNSVNVDTIPLRFSWKPFLRNNIFLLVFFAFVVRITGGRRGVKRLFPVLEQVDKIDICFAISGGDSFSDIYGWRRLLYVVMPQILAILSGKPLVLLPQTIGPFRGACSTLLARFVLENAIKIYSRDEAGVILTRKLLRDAKCHKNVDFCYDLGFLLEPKQCPAVDTFVNALREEKCELIGLNVSGLLMAGGYTCKNQFNLRIDYPELVFELVSKLLDRNVQNRVILVSHVFDSPNESDTEACRKVLQRLGSVYKERTHFIDKELAAPEVKYLIGKCDFFIGSRMHACIGALSQSIVTASLGYSDKFIGVMQSIGLTNTVIDLRENSINEIISKVYRIYDEKESIQGDLLFKMGEIRNSVLKTISKELINDYINANPMQVA